MRKWLTIAIAVLAVLGCSPDLRRVHTPELLDHCEPPSPRALPKVTTGTAVPPCEAWMVYSSLNPPDAAMDGDLQSAAVAPIAESRDQFILIDFGSECAVRQLTQLHPAGSGHPRRYRIDVAGSHNFPYTLVWTGEGSPEQSRAEFAQPVGCRFVRITLLEPTAEPWAVCELRAE